MLEKIRKFYARFCAFELVLGAVCLGTTVVVLTIAALSRAFGYPLNWSLDLALWLFTWSVFLGSDTALRADKMVNVDLLVKHLPAAARKAVQLVVYLMMAVFLLMLAVLGFELSYLSRFRTFQGIPTMSYTWVTLSIPICSTLMLITLGIKVKELFVPSRSAHKEAAG